MAKIKDSEGCPIEAFDRVMVCDARGRESSRLWRHDIFLDYDAERFPERPYLCAGGLWPTLVKILPGDTE